MFFLKCRFWILDIVCVLFHDEFLRTKKLKSHWIAIDTPLATTNPSEDLFIHRIKRITIENIYIYYDKDDELDILFLSKK